MILSKVLLSTGSNEDDEIALDTCCGWAFILSNKNKDMLEEVRTEDHVVQTLAGKTKYKTEVGKIGGEKALVTDSDFNLLGVGRLMSSLGDGASFEGDSHKMVLKYDDKEFYTAYFGKDYCPWGSLNKLISSIEGVLDIKELNQRSDLDADWLKSFVTLRERENLTNWKNKNNDSINDNSSNNHIIPNSKNSKVNKIQNQNKNDKIPTYAVRD